MSTTSMIDRIRALAPVIGEELAEDLAEHMVNAVSSESELEQRIIEAIAQAIRDNGAAGLSHATDAIIEALGDEQDFASLFADLGPREASDLLAAIQRAEITDRDAALAWIDVFARLIGAVMLAVIEGI